MPKYPVFSEEQEMFDRIEESLNESPEIDRNFLKTHATQELRKLVITSQSIEQALESNKLEPEQADKLLEMQVSASLAVVSSIEGIPGPKEETIEVLFQRLGRALISNPGGGRSSRSLERLGKAMTSNPGGGRGAGRGNPGGGRGGGEGSGLPES